MKEQGSSAKQWKRQKADSHNPEMAELARNLMERRNRAEDGAADQDSSDSSNSESKPKSMAGGFRGKCYSDSILLVI